MGRPASIGALVLGRRQLRSSAALLDTLSAKPAWAPCLHTRMSSVQRYAVRVRNESDAVLDVGYTPSGKTDLFAVSAHSGGGDCWLTRVYNPGTAGGFLEQTDPAKQLKVCTAGVVRVDARGQLAARFTAGVEYTASYVRSGDVAVTLTYDAAPENGDGYFMTGLFRSGDGFNQYASDISFDATSGYVEVGNDDNGDYGYFGYFDDDWDRAPGWFQFARAPGQSINAGQMRANGAEHVHQGDAIDPLTLDADLIVWGRIDWDTGNPPTWASTVILFEDVLGDSDQVLLDAWYAARYVIAPLSVDAVAQAITHSAAQGIVAGLVNGGLPPHSAAWTLLSGSLTFDDATALITAVTPSAADGDYQLRLAVTDSFGTTVHVDVTLTRMAAGATVSGVLGGLHKADFDAHDISNGAVASFPSTGLDATALAQATGADQPVRSATAFAPNSVAMPGVAFDYVNDVLTLTWGTPIPAGSRPYVWLVGWDFQQGSPRQVLMYMPTGDDHQYLQMVIETDGNYHASAKGSNRGAQNADSGVYMSNRLDGSVMEVGLCGDPFFAGVDGTMMRIDAPGPSLVDFAQLSLGAGGGFFSRLASGRLVVASDLPTLAQRAQVRALLASTWKPAVSDAGTPRWLPHGDIGSVTLQGSASAIYPLRFEWSLVSGPGSASFGTPSGYLSEPSGFAPTDAGHPNLPLIPPTTVAVGAAVGDYTCRLTILDAVGRVATSDVVVHRLADSTPFLIRQLDGVGHSPIFAVANSRIASDAQAAWRGFPGADIDYPTATQTLVTDESEMQGAFGASDGWAVSWIDQSSRKHHLLPGDRGHSPPHNDPAPQLYDGASGHALKVGTNLRTAFDSAHNRALGCIGTGGGGGIGGITGSQAFTVALLWRAGAIAAGAGPIFLGERVNNLQSFAVTPLSNTLIKIDFTSASITFACADVTNLNYLVIEHPEGGSVSQVTARQNGVDLAVDSVVNGSAVPDIFPSITNLALNDTTGAYWKGDILAAIYWDHALGAGAARDYVETWCQLQM